MSWQSVQLQDMLKSGATHLSGLEDAVYRNIEACKKMSEITRTSIGPNGMNKMVVNHLDKLFVTSDAATIVSELDINHPAAKLIVLASLMQEQEVGDGTNFVLVLAGQLLEAAHKILRMGLSPIEVADGYEVAAKQALSYLEEMVVQDEVDFNSEESLAAALRTAISSKQYGAHEVLSEWVAKACVTIMPSDPRKFIVDSIRVAKIPGAGVLDTTVVKGMVIGRDSEGPIKHVTEAKVAVFAEAIDISKTDTKGTVLLNNADQLLNYSKGEEEQIEAIVKAIADSGATVVVTGGNIGDMAQHFLNRYNLMSVKVLSKFDLRRLAKAIGATPMVTLGAPTAEEMGFCNSVSVEEIGSTKVCVFRQDNEDSGIATVVIRGSTANIMDDIERAVDDGVNCVKAMTKDARFVPGAGATEIELARRLRAYAETCPGLEQYAIKAYAEALESFPRTLAQNAGYNADEVIANLFAAHSKGDVNHGVNIETGDVSDAVEAGIIDLMLNKTWGIKFATDAAVTILRVDEIIMAKPAGGPKPPAQGGPNARGA